MTGARDDLGVAWACKVGREEREGRLMAEKRHRGLSFPVYLCTWGSMDIGLLFDGGAQPPVDGRRGEEVPDATS
jgi:hypothetical protein